MIFAIHQSRTNPTTYVFLRERDDLSTLPEGLREELGKLRFLRMAREKEVETPAIASKYQQIVQGIGDRGYHLIVWSSRELPEKSG
ncbi:MAG: YcgL domain-containing protein [Desulfovibrio sp.]|nr:YcgL domain-containing protein [Desulfovibrio sp.]